MKIVLVGGGKAAVILLNFFSGQEKINLVGISDLHEDAPGMVRARELRIPTTTKTEELLSRRDVDIIIELTGNAAVRSALQDKLLPGQDIMSANCAKLMCDIILAQASHDAAVADTVGERFKAAMTRLQTAIENIDVAYANVEKLLRETGLVTLNAKIESARAGQAGAAFSIVVDRMHEMLSDIREAMEKIANASTEGQETLASLKSAKDQLAEEFHLANRKADLS